MPPNLYDSDSDSDDAPTNGFKVNSAFAEKYETKKRTEELSKLQDKYGADYSLDQVDDDDDDDDSEDLSSDDSDADLVTPAVDVAILRTLAKIRKKDPSVYEAERQVFDEEEQRTSFSAKANDQSNKKSKTTKPVLLKDYQRARLIADPTNSLPDDHEFDTAPRTFAQEEDALKKETKNAFFGGDDEEEDDLLVPRVKSKDEREKEDEDYEKFLRSNVEDREVEDALEQEEKFLRDYILNRGWIDRASKSTRIPSYTEITGSAEPALPSTSTSKSVKSNGSKSKEKGKEKEEVTESGADAVPDPGENDDEDLDEEFDEKAEEFEHKYNFRFEEEAGPTIQTHARDMTTSVRRPTTVVSARARARELLKERKEASKVERKEEVRRLKALKRKEVEEKLKRIVEAAGVGVRGGEEGLEGLDLEGDWDEGEHDRKMRELYGEEYDGVDDDGFKPTWDDDIDISDIPGIDAHSDAGPDSDKGEGTSKLPPAEKPKKSKRKRDEEGFPTELLEAAKLGGGEARKVMLEKMVDDYYGLDYEDKIGDLATRFKYAKVPASSYNLTPAEILLATDAELNSFMSLRKMAPYRSSNSAEESQKEKKTKRKLKELRDALKGRNWGEELDEEMVEERAEKKRKWKEEGKKEKRGEKKSGADGEGEKREREKGDGKKRLGKKERKRLQEAATAEVLQE